MKSSRAAAYLRRARLVGAAGGKAATWRRRGGGAWAHSWR